MEHPNKFALPQCPDGEPACRQTGLVDALLPSQMNNKMVFWVYAIASIQRNYIYVGLTNNIERRVHQHNSGQNITTKPYLPFKIIYTEKFETRIDAREKEKYLKSGVGKEFLKTRLSFD